MQVGGEKKKYPCCSVRETSYMYSIFCETVTEYGDAIHDEMSGGAEVLRNWKQFKDICMN